VVVVEKEARSRPARPRFYYAGENVKRIKLALGMLNSDGNEPSISRPSRGHACLRCRFRAPAVTV
jgi:hypothetical protein